MPTPATRFWWSRPAPVSLRTSRKNEKSRWETWCISRPERNTGTGPRRTRHCPTSRSRRLVVRAAGDCAVLSQPSRSLARSEHDRGRLSVPSAHTLHQRYGRHAREAELAHGARHARSRSTSRLALISDLTHSALERASPSCDRTDRRNSATSVSLLEKPGGQGRD